MCHLKEEEADLMNVFTSNRVCGNHDNRWLTSSGAYGRNTNTPKLDWRFTSTPAPSWAFLLPHVCLHQSALNPHWIGVRVLLVLSVFFFQPIATEREHTVFLHYLQRDVHHGPLTSYLHWPFYCLCKHRSDALRSGTVTWHKQSNRSCCRLWMPYPTAYKSPETFCSTVQVTLIL